MSRDCSAIPHDGNGSPVCSWTIFSAYRISWSPPVAELLVVGAVGDLCTTQGAREVGW